MAPNYILVNPPPELASNAEQYLRGRMTVRVIAGIGQDLLESETNRKGRLVFVRSRNYLCARGDSVPSETGGGCQHRAATQDVEGDGRHSLEVELQFCSRHIDSVPHVVVAGKKAIGHHCRSDQRVIGI